MSSPNFGDAFDTASLDRLTKELGSVVRFQEDAMRELAQHVLNGRGPQPDRKPHVITMIGPPGVGKTVAAGYVADMLNSQDGSIPLDRRQDSELHRLHFLEVRVNNFSPNAQGQVVQDIVDFYDKLAADNVVPTCEAASATLADEMRQLLAAGASLPPKLSPPNRKAVILLDEAEQLSSLWRSLMQFFTHGQVRCQGKQRGVPTGWDLIIFIATNIGEDIIAGIPHGTAVGQAHIAKLKERLIVKVLKAESHASRTLNFIVVFRGFSAPQRRQLTRDKLHEVLDSFRRSGNAQLHYDELFLECLLSTLQKRDLHAARSIQAWVKQLVQTSLSRHQSALIPGTRAVLSCANGEPYLAVSNLVCLSNTHSRSQPEAAAVAGAHSHSLLAFHACDMGTCCDTVCAQISSIPDAPRIEFDSLLIAYLKEFCIHDLRPLGFRVSCPSDVLHLLRQARGVVNFSDIVTPVWTAVRKLKTEHAELDGVWHFELDIACRSRITLMPAGMRCETARQWCIQAGSFKQQDASSRKADVSACTTSMC